MHLPGRHDHVLDLERKMSLVQEQLYHAKYHVNDEVQVEDAIASTGLGSGKPNKGTTLVNTASISIRWPMISLSRKK
jgi:hypothetical protein